MERPVVYVVDDDITLRSSLEQLFESVKIEVQSFSDPESFLTVFAQERTGCLILELRLPGLTGIEFQRQLRAQDIDLPIIFLTGFGDVPSAVCAMRDGAFEFIEKPHNPAELLSRVRQAIELSRQLNERRDRQKVITTRMMALTEREKEVMENVVAGLPNKAIAEALGVSCKTIEFHRSRVMRKMKAASLPELVKAVVDVRREVAAPKSLVGPDSMP
ncbi:MAG: response regulator transcription factor [Planctomycetota bacterium]|jgi:FixJ family two-component response regulator